MTSIADLIVSQLRNAGVRALFGMPGGGSNLDLIDAAGRAGLPFVLTHTETAGAIAAIAQAELTGRPGACLTTLGPGVTSVVNGVACAFLDRAPLIVLTDRHPLASGDTFAHQHVDSAALLRPITKWSATITAANAADVMSRALAVATEEPCGPVHVDCAPDVTSVPSSGASASHSDASPAARDSGHDDAVWRTLVSRARKPMLLVGLGARRPDVAAAVRALCERRRIPAMVTYKAKGVIPDDHAMFAGVFTNAPIDGAALDAADLLLAVGLDPVELIPRPWTRAQPVVSCAAARFDARHVPFASQIVTPIRDGLARIEPSLSPSAWSEEEISQLVEAQRARVRIARPCLTAQDVVRVAAGRLAGRAIVAVDAGAHMFPITMLWPCRAPNELLISNGLSTMGFALPAAVGAALLDRDRPVVALTGDGGLLMCAAEIVTAVRERLRIIMIVFADASLSLIRVKQEQRKLAPAGVSLPPIPWRALATNLSAAGWSASTEDGLDRAIEQALTTDGVSIIEATIDPSNYAETLFAIRG